MKNYSIIKYQEKKDLNEVVVIPVSSTFAVTLILTTFVSTLYLILKLISYSLGAIHLRKFVDQKSIFLEKESLEISKLVNEPVKCYKLNIKNVYNAVVISGGKCYITESLYKDLSKREVIAAFLHEFGHLKKKHIIKRQGVDVTIGTVAYFSLNFLFTAFTGVFAGFITFLFAFISNKIGFDISNILSRKHEFVADEFAKKYGYEKELVSVLKKIEINVRKKLCKGMSEQTCQDLLDRASTTNPKTRERIEKLLDNKLIRKAAAYLSIETIKDDSFDLFNAIKKLFSRILPNINKGT